jgi:hypothetical protein
MVVHVISFFDLRFGDAGVCFLTVVVGATRHPTTAQKCFAGRTAGIWEKKPNTFSRHIKTLAAQYASAPARLEAAAFRLA